MLNSSQKKLSSISFLADAIIIGVAYAAAYYLRFSLLSKYRFFGDMTGVAFNPLRVYARYLVFVIPGYLVIYSKCGLYSAKKNRKLEYWDVIEANGIGILFFAFLLVVNKDTNISRLFLACFTVTVVIFEFAGRFNQQKGVGESGLCRSLRQF